MDSVKKTIAAREKTYGRYQDLAAISQTLQKVMSKGRNWDSMPAYQKEALQMIASKLARIVNGDHTHGDSWHDVAGYAKLVEDALGETPCPVDTTQSMSSSIKKRGRKSKSERPEIKPDTTLNGQGASIKAMDLTSTIGTH